MDKISDFSQNGVDGREPFMPFANIGKKGSRGGMTPDFVLDELNNCLQELLFLLQASLNCKAASATEKNKMQAVTTEIQNSIQECMEQFIYLARSNPNQFYRFYSEQTMDLLYWMDGNVWNAISTCQKLHRGFCLDDPLAQNLQKFRLEQLEVILKALVLGCVKREVKNKVRR